MSMLWNAIVDAIADAVEQELCKVVDRPAGTLILRVETHLLPDDKIASKVVILVCPPRNPT